jgi:hypothetical protein
VLLHAGARYVDEVRGRSELAAREDRRAGDAAVKSDQVDRRVKIRPEGLADRDKIPERERAAGESAARFVAYRGRGHGEVVVVGAGDVDVELYKESVPAVDAILERLEDRAVPGAVLLDVVVTHRFLFSLIWTAEKPEGLPAVRFF